MMNVSWTVKYDLDISTEDIKAMVINAHWGIGCGGSWDDSVHIAVSNYLMQQDDCIYDTITEEAREEIEAVISQRLKKYVKK